MKSSQPEITRRACLQGLGAVCAAGMVSQAASGEPQVAAPGEDTPFPVRARYYQQFNADFSLPVPEAAMGGWKSETLQLSHRHTAVVVMHAWATGKRYEEFPGWWNAVPYIPRANTIARDVFPPLLSAVRQSGLPLLHVVGGGDYYKQLPAYQRAAKMAGTPAPEPEKIAKDPVREALDAFRSKNVFPGEKNAPDSARGFAKLDFLEEARPKDGEGVAENGQQLFALCKEQGINHLIYCGFAINWCLLLSPGGMAEMQGHGMLCSTLRQATTAVESKESAAQEWAKELAMFRIALGFGFVFDVDNFIAALPKT